MIIPPTDIHTIITDPNGAEAVVKWADQLGKSLKENGLTTNQIRALFGEVRQIEARWNTGNEERQREENRRQAMRRLILLKPKMAYRARREQRGRAVQELVDVLNPALDEIIREKDPAKQDGHFTRFVEFFEAILAYHKSYGGN